LGTPKVCLRVFRVGVGGPPLLRILEGCAQSHTPRGLLIGLVGGTSSGYEDDRCHHRSEKPPHRSLIRAGRSPKFGTDLLGSPWGGVESQPRLVGMDDDPIKQLERDDRVGTESRLEGWARHALAGAFLSALLIGGGFALLSAGARSNPRMRCEPGGLPHRIGPMPWLWPSRTLSFAHTRESPRSGSSPDYPRGRLNA
jgi:hypothetical protein